jgi:hypothetical protein
MTGAETLAKVREALDALVDANGIFTEEECSHYAGLVAALDGCIVLTAEEASRENIAGAVARGWCHPDNEHKLMDEKLAWAIVDELLALLFPDEAALVDEEDE